MRQFPFNLREDILVDLGFKRPSIEKLRVYLEALLEWNQKLNLFSRQVTAQDLVDNHIVDCLLPLGHFPRSAKKIADLGSGGGLPVVLYALQFPELEFTAFEKSVRKRDFLQYCAKNYAGNLKIQGEIPQNLMGYDLITARAFKPIEIILTMSQTHFFDGGEYFLLKGRREKIDEEMILAKKKWGRFSAQILPLQSPLLDVQRHVVKIKR